MAFLYPVFLIGALSVAIPIALHLLRRDAVPEVPFSAVRLLRRSPVQQSRRRRLRDLLLLTARVAALLLLAWSFARPYFAAVLESTLHIVAIDRSFSMGAPGRFERAVSLAREAIDEARGGDPVALIAFDDSAEVIAEPGSVPAARAALDHVRAGFGGTRYAALLTRAAEMSQGGAARLVIVTDLQRAGWEDSDPVAVPSTVRIDVRDAGAPETNVAVVSVRRDRSRIIAAIRNTGPSAVNGTARVLSDGRQVAAAPFTAAPGGTLDLPIAYPAPDRGSLAVDIDDPQGYAADNRRYVVLDRSARMRVLVVTGESEQSGFFVTRALQTAGGDEGFDVRTVASSALGRIAPEEFSGNQAVLLLATRSLDRRSRDVLASFVRAGGGLLIAAGPEVDPAVVAAVMSWPDFSAVEHDAGPAVLGATDLRHPIFRPFGALAANLGQVRFRRAWRVQADGWDLAARFTDGTPALLERRDALGRVVVFASDVDRRWNDFPLHPAFVPFALEAVRHITAHVDRRQEFLVSNAPPGAKPEPGVYTIEPGGRRIAVNVDIRESSAARMTAEQFTAGIQPVDARPAAALARRAQDTEARQNLWRYGLLLMLAALCVESVIGRK